MKTALLIEFDGHTGERAGGISPRDPKLRCHGWQQLDTTPCLEIRVIYDNRDISQYKGIPGVTILHGKAAINAAIDDLDLVRYSIDNEALLRISIEQKKINLATEYEDMSSPEILKALHARKVHGIAKRSPGKV